MLSSKPCIFLIGAWTAGVLLALSGCGETRKDASPRTPAAPDTHAQAEMAPLPEVPGLDTTQASMDIAITHAAEDRQVVRSYTQNEKAASGSLLGICRFKDPSKKSGPVQIDTNKTILNPRPQELEYYSQFKFYEPNWVSEGGQVHGVVVLIRDIKEGAKPPLERPIIALWAGGFTPDMGSSSPFTSYVVLANGDRILFRNCEPFEEDFIITSASTGKEICHTVTPPNTHVHPDHEGWPDNADAWNKHHHGFSVSSRFTGESKTTPSAPIKETGYYLIQTRNRPWQKTVLAVVENPYVVAPGRRVRDGSVTMNGGRFTIDSIPPGRHTLEVWHPICEPVNKTIEVDIRPNETTEISIEFKLPASDAGR